MELGSGLLLTLVAGLFSGTCMLPMKFAKRWPWENLWLVFSLVSLLILPWALAIGTIPDIQSIYGALPGRVFLTPLIFGAGWGIAQILFGLMIARLGLALTYGIVVGLGAMLGTMVPLLINNRAVVATPRGAVILSGVAVMVLGIAVFAKAGLMRERRIGAPQPKVNYGGALALAVLCGFMAPMLNYAFAFGQPIAAEAVRHGTSPQAAGYAVWPIALAGGLLPNVGYCSWLLCRNRTWRAFRFASGPDVWLGSLMGTLWMGAFAIYGVASVDLGALGTSVGWGLLQIFMIIAANASGVLTGEWVGAPLPARRAGWTGLLLLSAATALMAAGNRQG